MKHSKDHKISLKALFQFAPTKNTASLIQWHFSKTVFGTFLFFLLFTLKLLEYFHFFDLENFIPFIQAAIATLIALTLGIPLIVQFFKKPLSESARFLSVLMTFGLFGLAINKMIQEEYAASFFMGAFLLYIFFLINYFEVKKYQKSNHYINDLKNLQPKAAFKKNNKEFIEVPIEELKKHDIIKVCSGAIIPMDGIILSGTTSVDESPLTGEFKPLLKGKGDQVVGATINRDSDITIEINKDPSETVLQKIIYFLNETRANKLPVYRKTSLFSLLLGIIGLFCAVGAFYYYKQYLQLPNMMALNIALSVFLSFSLVSLPISVIIESNIFQKNVNQKGIVLKTINSILRIKELDVLYLDKTGTLTLGNFAYSQYFLEHGTNQGKLLSTVFSLSKSSHHPLAQSMETHPWYHEIHKYHIKDHKEQAGLGICGQITPKGDNAYFAAMGNLRFLKRMQMQISRDMKTKIDDLETMGETVLLCGYHRSVRGILSFADTLRPNIRKTIKNIIALGIEPALITGDSGQAVTHLANEFSINKVYPRCTPEEKAIKVSKDISDGKIVGFVGSHQDHLPFEKSHVNFSIDVGSHISDQKADVMIMNSDVRLLSWLLKVTQNMYYRLRWRTVLPTILSLFIATTSALSITSPEFVMTLIFIMNLGILKSASFYTKHNINHDLIRQINKDNTKQDKDTFVYQEANPTYLSM